MFKFRLLPATAAMAAVLAAVLVEGLLMSSACAAPVSITTPFMNLEHRNINSLGFMPGEFVRIGAVSVTPNGDAGTTGVGTTTHPVTGQAITRTIGFSPSPVIPNFFSRNLVLDSSLLGAWQLRFTNGTDSATRTVSLPTGTAVLPFINSVILSGTSANPTFSWTPPPGIDVHAYRINIYDKSLINRDPLLGPVNGGQVTNRDLPPGVTSYTVNAADFSVPGYAFTLGKNYGIEISVIQTRDGSTRSSNDNLISIARSYADFTARANGGPVVNLPVVLENGAFKFDMAVQAGQTYYIDPEVAVGYDYAIGAGDPQFRSVVLPTDIGDGLYDILGLDAMGRWQLLADDISGGVVFDFGSEGRSSFRVLGIETTAALDPLNTTAFITGLSFTRNGRFSGTQTPITMDIAAVPEPPTLALVGLALWWLCSRRRSGDGLRAQQGTATY